MLQLGKVILNCKGYTLIELLFTIAILLIISIPISGLFLTSHLNNQDSRILEQSMLLGQRVLENRMSGDNIESELSENTTTNPPVSQIGDFRGLKVQTVVTAVNHNIAIEQDDLKNDKIEPSVPVEVIEGNTGKRTTYKLPLDTGVELSQVDNTVKPVGSVVEDYSYSEKGLELRSTSNLEGMDAIFHIEDDNIRRSTETLGVLGSNITLTFGDSIEPVENYKLAVSYGARTLTETLNLTGITNPNRRMRIAFVIDTEKESTLRRIKLTNKATFPLDIYIVRGIKDANTNTYFSGVGTGVNAGKSLLSLSYGTSDGSGGFLDNDPKLASDLIRVRENYLNKNAALVRQSRLYEIRVRVFREIDDANTVSPVVELRTYRRAIM